VDTNDSGSISFSEFSIWLVHRLGPKLMQKISESVQQMQLSSQDKAVTSPPESIKSSRVAQSTPDSSPYNASRLQYPEKYSSSVSPSPHSNDSTVPFVGNGSSQATFYFGLQVFSPKIIHVSWFFCAIVATRVTYIDRRLVSITLVVPCHWLAVSVIYVVGRNFCALSAAVSTRTLYAGK
jgi:hypothetical protein